MRKRVYIIALISAVSLLAHAQTFSPAAEDNTIQSQQIMQSGSNYNSTVYEPFSNTTPSEQSAVGASYSPAKAPTGPRKDIISPSNPGQQGEFPLGDGVIPLLLMATGFAVFVAVRRNARVE